MSIDPDTLEIDLERSRAAVAVACLQWLSCTGPAIDPVLPRQTPPEVADLLRLRMPVASPDQLADPGAPHPLWDRWLDG